MKETFPSLTGVIRFLMSIRWGFCNNRWWVSVPYRGYSFFNAEAIELYKDFLIEVSVPYRGYSFFNPENHICGMTIQKKFPSLTGVIRFLMMCVSKYLDIVFKDEFPSLTGVIRFLIWRNWHRLRLYRYAVSVPYRGYSFFNVVLWITKEENNSFRPLQGLFVF